MLRLLVALAVFVVIESKASLEFKCTSPQYWCQNTQTAQECNAVEYCTKQWEAEEHRVLDAAPVKVALYYESLCPGCRYFLTRNMYPAFQKLYKTGILEIELVPYGNARESKQGDHYVFQCQHGPGECMGNLIETCAMHILVNVSHYMPFIYCMESHQPTQQQAQSCARQLGIEYGPIERCVEMSEGNYLEHQMAQKTDALNPPHQYVPWITVDGKHTEAIQREVQGNMARYVCQHYQGTKPPECEEEHMKPCTNKW